MKQLLPGIWQWSWFSDEKQLDFNGLLLTINDHCILVDPPPLQPEDRTAILKSPRIDYVLITNRDHAREAETCRRMADKLEAKLAIPKPSAKGRKFEDPSWAADRVAAARSVMVTGRRS